MGGGISKMAKQELVATIRDRYRQASKKDKGRILDEFTAITGHHRKHGIRLLGGTADNKGKQALGRRIYDEAVREAVIVVWEASDRICGKRLKAALPNFVDSMERHGHLSLDPAVRERLHSASAATLDRLLKPIRATAGSRRKRRRRTYMGSQIPVRTYNDWNWPPPGFLEIDLVAHCGGTLSGSFIHSLVATDICTGWTEAVPLLAREQSLVVEGLKAIAGQLPFPVLGIDSDNDSVFINQTLMEYCADRGIEFTRSRALRPGRVIPATGRRRPRTRPGCTWPPWRCWTTDLPHDRRVRSAGPCHPPGQPRPAAMAGDPSPRPAACAAALTQRLIVWASTEDRRTGIAIDLAELPEFAQGAHGPAGNEHHLALAGLVGLAPPQWPTMPPPLTEER